jgi:predicted ATPase/DNA-binding CsgD family transcriptional regulator
MNVVDGTPRTGQRCSDGGVAGRGRQQVAVPCMHAERGSRVALLAYGNRFVGRDSEVEAVCRMLVDGPARLVTLTGPPGIGKTRLAVVVAAEYARSCAVEPVFVDLEPIRDIAAVPAEVARALGVQSRGWADLLDRVSGAGGEAEGLIVVDNCEHVLSGVTGIARLLPPCPGLRILATSRERMRLSAEWEYPVPALAMPAATDARDLVALAANASIALLVDRARQTNPRFGLDAGNAASLVKACVELEGLPLALELAAARLKLLTPGELAFRLGRRLDLLSGSARDVPARQRALRAAIGWSYDLLAAVERAMFRRLSVFAGSWTEVDARAVCGDGSSDTTGVVESLLEKNLVRRAPGDGVLPAFSMLASLREFAAERLEAEDETSRFRARHAAHYGDIAVRLEAELGAPEEREWWISSIRYQADLLAALDYSRATDDRDRVLWLAAALGWCWYTRGDLGHAVAVIDGVLAVAHPHAAEPGRVPGGAGLIAATVVAGVLALASGELERADEILKEALRGSKRAADLRHAVIAQAFLGQAARVRGRYEESARWHNWAAEGFARLGNTQGVAWAQHDLGLLARDRGDLDQAVALLRASLRAFRDLDYPWAVAWSAWGLGTALCEQGRFDQARPLLGEALGVYRDLGDPRGVAQCFEALACVAADGASYDSAALLLGSAAGQRARLAAPPPDSDRARAEAVERTVGRCLGTDVSERLRHLGRSMPVEHAMRIATDIAEGRPASGPDRDVQAQLTRRERQVVALVAAGHTNRQIGRMLGISEKTTEVHLHHVMSKLGARSRAQVAVWAVAHDARASQ